MQYAHRSVHHSRAIFVRNTAVAHRGWHCALCGSPVLGSTPYRTVRYKRNSAPKKRDTNGHLISSILILPDHNCTGTGMGIPVKKRDTVAILIYPLSYKKGCSHLKKEKRLRAHRARGLVYFLAEISGFRQISTKSTVPYIPVVNKSTVQ